MNLDSGIGAGRNARLYSLARHALVGALRVVRISRGQGVLVPEFICRDLLASIHAAGAEPVYYPVDRSLAPQLPPPAPDVKAVVAVNYFGFPQPLDPFRAYCAGRDAALIEDNAHGFLSRDDKGEPLGSRGDLGLFSLRKTFAFPDGAALVVNRQDWVDRLPAPLPCRSDPLPVAYRVKRTLRQIQDTTGIPARSLGQQMARHLRWFRTGHAVPVASLESEREIPGAPAIHCDTVRMLGEIDAAGEVERRRALYGDFHAHLRNLDVAPVFGELLPGVAPYGYPFRANDPGARAVDRIARARGLDCFRWPDLPVAVAPAAPDHYRNVWWVNFLC